MTPLQNLSVEQLRKLVAIREQIETLQREIESITGGGSAGAEIPKHLGRKKMSFAARARLAASARWARVRAGKAEAWPHQRPKMSAATKAKMAAAAKARWAKAKAAGKNRL
jgi:hypothetical protein